ncbi:hypothetical protein ACWDSD_04340 [Streptomyces spiralis]|uniref:Uncharacterized protein n=1 Tax=Streptomyces spiralis TaxID=66376 RepID=A0A919DSA2_9ACTN|nr:hypothetical protein [Streptomyces spiralis]GHE74972.1 hypothetical protein GCM10014715_32070 [Streptomyces spiralis]
MSAATIHPAPAARPAGDSAVPGSPRLGRHHRLGDALHAVKVFMGAAFDVIVLGEYGEEAGIRNK